MGVTATQMERRGLATERGTVNREIVAQPEKKPSIWEQLQQAQVAVKPTTRYGKVKAFKENAALFGFLQENGISSIQRLHAKAINMQTEYYGLCGEIAATARQINDLEKCLSMWEQYADNKLVYQRLTALKSGAREKFQDAHGILSDFGGLHNIFCATQS
ncbi:MAG: hypothetical protein ABF449_11305 [Ethanoligenens sp.]